MREVIEVNELGHIMGALKAWPRHWFKNFEEIVQCCPSHFACQCSLIFPVVTFYGQC